MGSLKNSMKNKVYYGEFSLEYWIHLMLIQNIILPPYQRYFVWQDKDIKKFIKQVKENSFVPPITIGAHKDIFGKRQNIIIDGQQRLTSILLAAIGLCPDYAEMKKASGDEKVQWTYNMMLTKDCSIASINARFKSDKNYKDLDCGITEEILKTTYLGFSYIIPEVPDNENNSKQQIFYSTVFRNINYGGVHLEPIESRKSLYYLDPKLTEFFEPEIASKIVYSSTNKTLDFVRDLAIITQYFHNSKKQSEVLKNQVTTIEEMETYYESYIHSVVGNYDETDYEGKRKPDELFGKFDEIFKDVNISDSIKHLTELIQELEFDKIKYDSILTMDVYMLGIIYYTLFERKDIDVTKKDALKNDLDESVKKLKKDSAQTNKPSNATKVRARLMKSISTYRKYLKK